jgi:hypothetical protein
VPFFSQIFWKKKGIIFEQTKITLFGICFQNICSSFFSNQVLLFLINNYYFFLFSSSYVLITKGRTAEFIVLVFFPHYEYGHPDLLA